MLQKYINIFFFNDTATTEIYTLSLHDALPISQDPGEFSRVRGVEPEELERRVAAAQPQEARGPLVEPAAARRVRHGDRKSTRLNSQSRQYLVCRLLLEKKNTIISHFTSSHN